MHFHSFLLTHSSTLFYILPSRESVQLNYESLLLNEAESLLAGSFYILSLSTFNSAFSNKFSSAFLHAGSYPQKIAEYIMAEMIKKQSHNYTRGKQKIMDKRKTFPMIMKTVLLKRKESDSIGKLKLNLILLGNQRFA